MTIFQIMLHEKSLQSFYEIEYRIVKIMSPAYARVQKELFCRIESYNLIRIFMSKQ
jgi:hypothetical protein